MRSCTATPPVSRIDVRLDANRRDGSTCSPRSLSGFTAGRPKSGAPRVITVRGPAAVRLARPAGAADQPGVPAAWTPHRPRDPGQGDAAREDLSVPRVQVGRSGR
jgi:hypothetical protein